MKVKMINPQGNPTEKSATGAPVIIARGAIVDLPDFWAKKFIASGDAEEIVSQTTKPKKKNK